MRQFTASGALAGVAVWLGAILITGVGMTPVFAQTPLPNYRVTGDAIPAPLTAEPGDPERGRAVVADHDTARCILCHEVPGLNVRFMGNVGPSLAGIGARLTAGQIRLWLVDPQRANPTAVMPSYYRVEGLRQVAPAYRGKPILTAQQIEDAVAYLESLK